MTVAGSSHSLLVRRLVGGACQALGGALETLGRPSFPDLAMGPDDLPMLAWSDRGLGTQGSVYVQRWDGGGRVQLGPTITWNPSSSDAFTPRIAIGQDGHPVLTWRESVSVVDDDKRPGLYAMRWSGVAWEPLGDGIVTIPNVANGGLGIDPQGRPVAAFLERQPSSGPTLVHVHHFAASDWQPLGQGLEALSGAAQVPDVAVEDGGPTARRQPSSSGVTSPTVRTTWWGRSSPAEASGWASR